MSQASAGVGGSHQEIVTLFRTIICQMRNAEEPPVIIFIKLGYYNDLGLNADLRSKAVLGMNPAGMAYVPTEEERRVFRECNQESFWYRSLPFSAMGMLVTQGLISRGIFTSSSRFGSIPKVAFAGVCGYLAGKMSYMKTCQEKFKKLENSPLGEALRQGHRTFPPQFAPEKSEFSDAEKPDYQSSFQSVLQPPPTSSSYSDDFSYTDRSLSTYEPAQFGSSPSGAEDLSPQAPGLQIEDETPKKAPIMYEELRNKNRENYEVTMTQKAEVLLKPQQDRAPKTEVKKNMYGDTWDE